MPGKKWTVMVWMAGDNNLESFGESDIKEMKKVGTTNDFDVVVQFDRMSTQHTCRYHLHAGSALEADKVADLGPTNTGDPAVASDFFTWAIQQYPADRYLGVLWNHGSGIDETNIYDRARSIGLTVERRGGRSATALPHRDVRVIAHSRYRGALFSSTVDAALKRRGIGYDDTARDFLDNAELQKVLKTVKDNTGRILDLVGFDACLMSMVEVAYQLRQFARFTVGSEQTEPGDGWPYDLVLSDLAANASMAPGDFGAAIVKRYVESYKKDEVTLSLLDLGRSDEMAEAVDALGRALKAAIAKPAEYAAVTKAVRAAQHYQLPDFLDLGDLCEQIKKRSSSAAAKKAADGVIEALGGAQPFVAAEKHKGAGVANSHGAAIYFPRGEVTVAYGNLALSKATAWDEFVTAYQKA